MYQKIKRIIYEFFFRLRCWIDDEAYVNTPLSRSKSRSDEFAEKVVRELETVMNREKFCYQGEKILLPTKYIVYISKAENFLWVGRKREALEKKLLNYIGKVIRPVADHATLMPQNYEIKIKVDDQLKEDEIKILHIWEERNPEIEINFAGVKRHIDLTSSEATTKLFQNALSTIVEDEEVTVFRPNSKRHFCIEVWRYGIRQEIIPVFLPEVRFGRGSPNMSVEILLKGDADISRLHATLRKERSGKLSLHISGRKPIIVSGQQVFAGETVPISIGEELKIGSYSLCLRN